MKSVSLSTHLLRLLLVLTVLAVWQTVSGTLIPEYFVSKPTVILRNLWEWASDGSLFFHAAVTATEAFAGFALGSALGIGAGLLLGRSRFLADLLEPFIMAFYSLPKVALAPLFVLWLGIGIEMKIVLTASVVFFLVFLNTYTGVRNVSHELLAILRLMGANERQLLTKVVLPSAVTWVFTGLRISVPYALIGAIVGELIASNRGLGYLLSSSAGQFNTGGVFAALAATIVLSSILNVAVMFAERFAMPWKAEDPAREVSI
jgi:NitT/TauT family transport system permease protein